MMAFFFKSASVTAFAVCVLPFSVSAQPVVTSADAPVPGMAYPYTACVAYSGLFQVNWQITGPDAVWHLSGLLDTDSGSVDIIDPASAACADTFPAADVAIRYPGSMTEFDSVTGQAVFTMGFCDEGTDQFRILEVPVRSMIWPCAFMSSWSDELAWHYPGLYVHGTRHDTVDGYGALELPWGTVPGVLAIRETDTMYVSPGNDTVPHLRWARRFVRPGWPVDIAHIWTFAPGDSLGYSGPHGGGYLDEGVFASIAEQKHAPTMPVAWDPVTGLLTLGLPSGAAGEAVVIDAAGRVAIRTGWKNAPIAAGAMADGVYTVRFTDRATGRVLGGRFVKCGW